MKASYKLRLYVFTLFCIGLSPPSPLISKTTEINKFSLTYFVEVKKLLTTAGKLDVWVPFPTNNEDQNILDVSVDAPYPMGLNFDGEWGNGMLFFSVNNPSPFKFKINYLVERRARKVTDFDYQRPINSNGFSGHFSKYLRPSKFAVINDSVKKFTSTAVEGQTNALARSRGIYDFVFSQLRYDKTFAGWGRGDVDRLCFFLDQGKPGTGNCTDFHSLFSAMLQVQGIPVKFEMGYPLTPAVDQPVPKSGGYHCWAKFFIPGYGWIPVDISEASKAPEKKEYFWGGIDADRILFSTGRDILLNPPQQGQRLNFFGPDPYMELDGKLFNGFVRSISYRYIK